MLTHVQDGQLNLPAPCGINKICLINNSFDEQEISICEKESVNLAVTDLENKPILIRYCVDEEELQVYIKSPYIANINGNILTNDGTNSTTIEGSKNIIIGQSSFTDFTIR